MCGLQPIELSFEDMKKKKQKKTVVAFEIAEKVGPCPQRVAQKKAAKAKVIKKNDFKAFFLFLFFFKTQL